MSTVTLCWCKSSLSPVVQIVVAEGVMPERDSGTTATAPVGAPPLSGPASGGPAAGAAQGEHLLHMCLTLSPECLCEPCVPFVSHVGAPHMVLCQSFVCCLGGASVCIQTQSVICRPPMVGHIFISVLFIPLVSLVLCCCAGVPCWVKSGSWQPRILASTMLPSLTFKLCARSFL